MSKEGGVYLSQLLAGNTTITKVTMDFNPEVPPTIIADI